MAPPFSSAPTGIRFNRKKTAACVFFCENRGKRRRKKDLRKKKAFAFFYMKILSSFFPLFSFVPLKSAAFPTIFMSGLRLRCHGGFLH
jgi:hypothetical protein